MRVIVTGSTKWTDAAAIRRELAKLPAGSTIIHSDSPGVDALAGQVARELGLRVEPCRKGRTDYRRYRTGAWKGLNERMAARGADLVLAFHPEIHEKGKARGSRHMVEVAEEQGIEARTFSE